MPKILGLIKERKQHLCRYKSTMNKGKSTRASNVLRSWFGLVIESVMRRMRAELAVVAEVVRVLSGRVLSPNLFIALVVTVDAF